MKSDSPSQFPDLQPLEPCPMHVNELLKIAVDAGASDLHLKVGSYPMMRVRGELVRRQRGEAARPRRRREHERRRDVHVAAAEVQGGPGSRPGLQRPRPRPLPLQHLPAARHGRRGPARHPDADSDDRRAGPAPGAQDDRRGRARARAGHRHDGQRQEHDARRAHRPHQPHALRARDDGRGSDRVPAPRPAVDRQPARSGGGHAVLRPGPPQRPAAGSRRHPRRRDARLRDDRDRHPRVGNRSPRVLHAAHARRDRNHQPHHRRVPAAPAEAGAPAARERAEGRRLAAPHARSSTARAARRRSR